MNMYAGRDINAHVNAKWNYIQLFVNNMPTPLLRKTLRQIDRVFQYQGSVASAADIEEEMLDLFMPSIGLTVGEFCTAYLASKRSNS